jgi:hypothetical protein
VDAWRFIALSGMVDTMNDVRAFDETVAATVDGQVEG